MFRFLICKICFFVRYKYRIRRDKLGSLKKKYFHLNNGINAWKSFSPCTSALGYITTRLSHSVASVLKAQSPFNFDPLYWRRKRGNAVLIRPHSSSAKSGWKD